MNFRIKIFIFLCVFLSGCIQNKNYIIKNIDFSLYSEVDFNANGLVIQDNSNQEMKSPYIDHLIQSNIKSNLKKWANARIKTNSNDENIVKLIIKKASTKAFSLDQENNLEDIFLSKASLKIEIDVFIVIEIINANNEKLAYVDIKIFKSEEFSENISLNERDYYIQEMINDTVNDFDRLAINKMKEIFINYITF